MPNLTTLNTTLLHHTTLHYTPVQHTTLHHATPQYATLHYIPLHYTLHYPHATPHYSKPHYTTVSVRMCEVYVRVFVNLCVYVQVSGEVFGGILPGINAYVYLHTIYGYVDPDDNCMRGLVF